MFHTFGVPPHKVKIKSKSMQELIPNQCNYKETNRKTNPKKNQIQPIKMRFFLMFLIFCPFCRPRKVEIFDLLDTSMVGL